MKYRFLIYGTSRSTDELDRSGRPIFRYTGKTRDRHEDPTT